MLGVSYQFSAFRFNPSVESINSHSVQVTIGHHISNRLMFQAGGGPQMYSVTPLVGPSTGLQLSWGSNVSMIYQLNHTTLSGFFSRQISGGSGILAGATTSQVGFTASRQIGQWTTFTGTVGYAVNDSLQLPGVPASSFSSVFASAGFSHRLSRSFSMNASYNFSHQGANTACAGPGCANTFLRHQIWVGVTWDMHPIPIN